MIIIDEVILSDDIRDCYFHCQLEKCKGACCVQGDQGAPLEKEELPVLEQIYDIVKPYLPEKSIQTIAEKGLYEYHEKEGDYTTSVNGKNEECVFAIQDTHGVWKCGIEKAYYEGKISFQKPVSCHLYPIRITHAGGKDLLNYDRWEVCNPACEYGNEKKTPLYKFVQTALVRKYGQDWFNKLLNECEK